MTGQSSTPSASTRWIVLRSPPKVPVPGETSLARIQSHPLRARLARALATRSSVSAAKPMTRAGRSLPRPAIVARMSGFSTRRREGGPLPSFLIKKDGKGPPSLRLVENPDILATIAGRGNDRPALVIGFAAETDDLVANARAKRARKGCDWILANDVSPGTGTFGGDRNTIHLVDADGVEDWPVMTKAEVATRLARRIADHLSTEPPRSGA